VLGASERLVHVPFGHCRPRGDRGLIELRRVGIENGRQGLEFELYRVHRAPRELGLFRGGHRQAVADEAGGGREDACGVGGDEHGDDAGESLRGRGVGPDDAGVGQRRATEGQVQRAGQREVASEGGLARRATEAHRSPRAAASTAATGLA
jgi:hypothetical protein